MIFQIIAEIAIGGVLLFLFLAVLSVGFAALILFLSILTFSLFIGGVVWSQLLSLKAVFILLICICLIVIVFRLLKLHHSDRLFDMKPRHFFIFLTKKSDINLLILAVTVCIILVVLSFNMEPIEKKINTPPPIGKGNIQAI